MAAFFRVTLKNRILTNEAPEEIGINFDQMKTVENLHDGGSRITFVDGEQLEVHEPLLTIIRPVIQVQQNDEG